MLGFLEDIVFLSASGFVVLSWLFGSWPEAAPLRPLALAKRRARHMHLGNLDAVARSNLTVCLYSTQREAVRCLSTSKRQLDDVSGVKNWVIHDLRRTVVSGMARLGVAPHVADKILNHTSGSISGVAAVYQRHEFMAERKEALTRWGDHVSGLIEA
jgi:hypothetical protein